MHCYSQKYLIWICALLVLVGDVVGQSVVEVNAWDRVLMAPNNVVKIEALKAYIASFCEGNGAGRNCVRARRDLVVLETEMPAYLLQKHSANPDLSRSIEELNLILETYPIGAYAQEVRTAISQKEATYWNSIFQDVTKWHQDSFARYLQIFPNAAHSEIAHSQVDLLSAQDLSDPQSFYDLFINGKGRERLKYFQHRYPEHAAALDAQQQLEAIEEALWQDVERRGQIEDFRRYLTRTSQNKYQRQAENALEDLMREAGKGPVSRKDRQWLVIRNTNDPQLVRDFLAQYQGDSIADKVRVKLIELDQGWWDEAISLSTSAAYQGYLRRFPNGAFAGDAADSIATLTNDDEDMLWSSTTQVASMEHVQAYLQRYPQGKYVALAQKLLAKLSPAIYQITHKDHSHIVDFTGTKNLKVTYFPDDLIVDDQLLQAQQRIVVTPLNLGFYHILLEDEQGREILVDWNRDILVAFFKEQDNLISMMISGGYQPYKIRLQDTTTEMGNNVELERTYPKGSVTLDKELLRDLIGPGTYALKIKDESRKQIAHAGVVTFEQDWGKLMLLSCSGCIALLGGFMLWRRFNRKINVRKSVFDDMEYDEDWEVEG